MGPNIGRCKQSTIGVADDDRSGAILSQQVFIGNTTFTAVIAHVGTQRPPVVLQSHLVVYATVSKRPRHDYTTIAAGVRTNPGADSPFPHRMPSLRRHQHTAEAIQLETARDNRTQRA